ncbi:DUF4271 domain-containing protein [Rhizosphaericola mali]|uniref:DUF4271 domain-containing protein n=1 Tax=Rhizosphaericola mali TaxID=2545455 RepID=A0A5P2G9V6_9BACT|nr:DUF4271 domain-containing protein [Rhizosphaericola mali]QES89983.1 DUF4271 domain-containing protein [Rhizosphaericola mali]
MPKLNLITLFLNTNKCTSLLCKGLALLVFILIGWSVQAQVVSPTKPIKKAPTTHAAVKDTLHKKKKAVVATFHRKDSTIRKATLPVVQKKKNFQAKDSIQKSINNEVINGPSNPKINTTIPSVATNKPATTIKKIPKKAKVYHFKKDSLFAHVLYVPYLPMKKKPIYVIDDRHHQSSNDELFYIVGGIFFVFGLVRTAFPRYVDNLFYTFFSPASRGKKEMVLGQNKLPSLLTNIVYCIGFGFLLTLVLYKFGTKKIDLIEYWIYITLGLAGIYFVKFVTISLSGYIFNAKEDAGTYANIVFQINKIIGFISLPFILIFAFVGNPNLDHNLLTIGAIILVALLIYRYIISFSLIAKNLQLNAFHFFLYLCTVEIIPILVLYKLFFNDLSNKIL